MKAEQFELIYSAHYKAAFQYAYYLCQNEKNAEDLTQEAFLKYYKSLSKFRGDCSELTWICRIIKNLYLDQLKKEKRKSDQDFSKLIIVDEKDYFEKIDNRDITKQVHRVLHHLSEPYKEVFSLRVFGELSFAEIAELFQKTESWARVTYHRAKIKIVEQMNKEV